MHAVRHGGEHTCRHADDASLENVEAVDEEEHHYACRCHDSRPQIIHSVAARVNLLRQPLHHTLCESVVVYTHTHTVGKELVEEFFVDSTIITYYVLFSVIVNIHFVLGTLSAFACL